MSNIADTESAESELDALKLDEDLLFQIIDKYFDADFYVSRYSDIDPDRINPLHHYCLYGWREGRDPVAWFCTASYLADNPDVAASGLNAFFHYITFGRDEGRTVRAAANLMPDQSLAHVVLDGIDPPAIDDDDNGIAIIRRNFDAKYYTDHYSDIDPTLVDPAEHYLLYGWREGRNPRQDFSTSRYLARNPDVAAADVNPFLHYLRDGIRQGRQSWPVTDDQPFEMALDVNARMVTEPSLRALIEQPHRLALPPATDVDGSHLDLHWAVPDFDVGSGGHMTIFRIIRWLEIFGHRCTVWIADPTRHHNADDAFDDIVKHFQTIGAPVRLLDKSFDAASGDYLIATGWQTVAYVADHPGFRRHGYFVQDYEPYFYATGSHSLAATNTYSRNLDCLCASPWLAELMRKRHGRWADHFWLGYDHSAYFPRRTKGNAEKARDNPTQGSVPQIALYARTTTARRAVELALLSLEVLARDGIAFHVHLFGADMEQLSAPFPCTLHGILDHGRLGDLYRHADVGICFSATNYSLVPQEMMACGLPVVELDGESTRAIFPRDVVTLAPADPLAMADCLATLLADPSRRRRQAENASRWVGGFTWESAARKVEAMLLDRLGNPAVVKKQIGSPYASVCIPTFNGGDLLAKVVESIRMQRAPWRFEIIIVDSSSTDGSIEAVERAHAAAQDKGGKIPTLRIVRIPKHQFQHGRTRNLCVSEAKAEFIAFLTQDAKPADEFWLYNIVTVLAARPQAAGAFGKHLAWPDATVFTHRDIDQHFHGLSKFPLILKQETDFRKLKLTENEFKKILHFYSDNNSCLRKSVWNILPYPEVDYGEDQIWAHKVTRLGYEKLYVPSSVVYHSHDYTPAEIAERAKTEAKFFKRHFGYNCLDLGKSVARQLQALNNSDRDWAKRNGIGDGILSCRLIENKARLSGFAEGLEIEV